MRNAVIRKKRLQTGQLLYEWWMRSSQRKDPHVNNDKDRGAA